MSRIFFVPPKKLDPEPSFLSLLKARLDELPLQQIESQPAKIAFSMALRALLKPLWAFSANGQCLASEERGFLQCRKKSYFIHTRAIKKKSLFGKTEKREKCDFLLVFFAVPPKNKRGIFALAQKVWEGQHWWWSLSRGKSKKPFLPQFSLTWGLRSP